METLAKALLLLVTILALIPATWTARYLIGTAAARRANRRVAGARLNLPEVDRLEILPVVEFEAGRAGLATEPGVSYFVTTAHGSILFDLGYNKADEEPSPLLRNARALGVDLSSAAALCISHPHKDHCGGPAVAETGEAWSTRSHEDLGVARRYAPVPLRVDGAEATVVAVPAMVTPDVAATGPLVGQAFFAGPITELSLMVNVKGKGLVVIVGCGHPGIAEIGRMACRITGLPLYAVVGGLHLYLGESNAGPLAGRASTRFLGLPQSKRSLGRVVRQLERLGLKQAYISPHDSSDETLDFFDRRLAGRFTALAAGVPVVI